MDQSSACNPLKQPALLPATSSPPDQCQCLRGGTIRLQCACSHHTIPLPILPLPSCHCNTIHCLIAIATPYINNNTITPYTKHNTIYSIAIVPLPIVPWPRVCKRHLPPQQSPSKPLSNPSQHTPTVLATSYFSRGTQQSLSEPPGRPFAPQTHSANDLILSPNDMCLLNEQRPCTLSKRHVPSQCATNSYFHQTTLAFSMCNDLVLSPNDTCLFNVQRPTKYSSPMVNTLHHKSACRRPCALQTALSMHMYGTQYALPLPLTPRARRAGSLVISKGHMNSQKSVMV